MISNPKNGQCDFKIDMFLGKPCCSTNAALDLLNMFIEYYTKDCAAVRFDEGETEFLLVLSSGSVFIIVEQGCTGLVPKDTMLLDYSEFDIKDLALEVLTDIRNEMDGWVHFIKDYSSDDVTENRANIESKMKILETLLTMKDIEEKYEEKNQ